MNYTLFFDDSGTKTFKWGPGQPLWFALGGFVVENVYIENIKNSMRSFHDKWQQKLGLIIPPLHSSDIRSKKDGFEFLKNTQIQQEFLTDVLHLILESPILVVGSVIDISKYEGYVKNNCGHSDVWSFYDTAYPILIERTLKHVILCNSAARLWVVGEQSGKIEDKKLREIHEKLITSGTANFFDKNRSEKYAKLEACEYTRLEQLSLKSKNSELLQLADIVLFAICKAPSVYSAEGSWFRTFKDLSDKGKLINNIYDEKNIKNVGLKYFLFDKNVVEAIAQFTKKP